MTKFERDKTYKTRDGREARVICVDAPGKWSVVALVYVSDGWVSLYFSPAGRYLSTEEHPYDLMLPKPEPIVEWGFLDDCGRFHKYGSEKCARLYHHVGGSLAKRVTTFED